MYKATQDAGPEAGAQPGADHQEGEPQGAASGDENVTDAEFEEVK